jgi:hypothetical protein
MKCQSMNDMRMQLIIPITKCESCELAYLHSTIRIISIIRTRFAD